MESRCRLPAAMTEPDLLFLRLKELTLRSNETTGTDPSNFNGCVYCDE